MTWLSEKISDLRNRPYAERVKILKILVVLVVVLLLLIWFLTLRFRQHTQRPNQPMFQSVIDAVKKLKDSKAK